MKRLRWSIPLLFCLVVVGFGLLGAKYRSTYTDLTAQPDYIQDFFVAELPESLCENTCQLMAQDAPNSPIIARVTPTSDLEPMYYTSRQPFLVQEVFAGEALQAGQVIWIGGIAGAILPGGNPNSVECGYVNLPQPGREYLVFLSGQVEIVDGFPTAPTYLLANFRYVHTTPIFCYEDFGTTITADTDGHSTYVPYAQVSTNEFFATSQKGLKAMLELKHTLLELYPKGSGDM